MQQVTFGSSQVLPMSIIHYPPDVSNINNLTFVVYGSGHPGIYNSSSVPNLSYGIYNWCNMPHARIREYEVPPSEYVLRYVEVIQRHHKRTPYASNTFPLEDTTWSCSGSGAGYGARNPSGKAKQTSLIQWDFQKKSANPFVQDAAVGFGNSTCAFPQITSSGLEDSVTHGEDLGALYRKLHFLPRKYDAKTVAFRVTNNVITSQVASGLVPGMFGGTEQISVGIQSSSFDSLEPTYSCPKANSVRSSYITNGAVWTDHLRAASSVYAQLDAVSSIPPNDSGGFHASFDHYYDNLSAKQCHGKPLPCNLADRSLCVTQQLADTVYRLGHWEYSYQYRDAEHSTLYGALRFGVFFLELKQNIFDTLQGVSTIKYRHNIAHDGSMSSLFAVLQLAQMVWPGMGSEVIFEVYTKKGGDLGNYIRVLWSGQPMRTSTPLGILDMISLDSFLDYINTMVGSASELYAACHAS